MRLSPPDMFCFLATYNAAHVGGFPLSLKSCMYTHEHWHVHWIWWQSSVIQMNQQVAEIREMEKENPEKTTCSLSISLLQSCSNLCGQKIALLHCDRQYTINYTSGPYVRKLDCKCKCLCALTCAWIQGCADVHENGHMHHFCLCIFI